MQTAALALTLALAPAPSPSPDAGLLGDVVGGVTGTVDGILGTGPKASPSATPKTSPAARTEAAPSPARTTQPGPAPTKPADSTGATPSPLADPAGVPAPVRAPERSGAATPGPSGAAGGVDVDSLSGPSAVPFPATETRTVYVVGLAALALPAGWWVLRRRKPRETPSAASYEAAYELGRADERATAAQPAAKVLPFRKR